MSRWSEVVHEEPPREVTGRLMNRIEGELEQMASRQDIWWRRFAFAALGALSLFFGYKAVQFGRRQKPSALAANPDLDFLMEAVEENADLEFWNDLELLEDLEEIEKWRNG
jgi:hypothetical protein